MKETLGLVPQVFYDLIGRVVPGAAVVTAGVLLLADRAQTQAAARDVMTLPGAALGIAFVFALMGAYLAGVLLGAIGFLFENRRLRTTKFADLLQSPPPSPLEEIHLPYVYDFILIRNPAAGTRLVKLRAESHMCRVLIVGCATLFIAYAARRWSSMNLEAWLVLAALVLAAIAAFLFQRHLQVRAWLLQVNCWSILNSPPESGALAAGDAHLP